MSNNAPIVGNQKLILTIFFQKLDDVSKFKFITEITNIAEPVVMEEDNPNMD